MTTTLAAPARPFRIIRGEAANYRTHAYKTKENRDAAANRFAAQDGDTVLTELWSADHPQDDLNNGWACDGAAYPPGREPKPEPETLRPHERVGASDLSIGDDVAVFAFEQGRDASGFRSGWLAALEPAPDHFGQPALTLTLTNGARFDVLTRAVAYVYEPHEARQCSCAEFEQDEEGYYTHNCCNACSRPITDMGGYWAHTDEPEPADDEDDSDDVEPEPAGPLLAEYDDWRQERADLSADPATDSDDWHASDDTGCDLAARLAATLRATVTSAA